MARCLPVLLLVAAAALYLPVAGHGWVWDDHALILEDLRVTDGGGLAEYLTPYWDGSRAATPGSLEYTRPLVMLSFRLQYAMHGPEPSVFHLYNLGLHLAGVILLFFMFRHLELSETAATLGAAIFALYPTQVEPVAWISGRTDLMAFSFGLTAWLLHRRARGLDRWSLAAGLCLLASLFSKETGWVFIPLMAGWDVLSARLEEEGRGVPNSGEWALSGGEKPGEEAWAGGAALEGASAAWDDSGAAQPPQVAAGHPTWHRWIPLAVSALIAIVARWAALSGALDGSLANGGAPVWVTLLRVGTSAGHYLHMLVWPWNPSALPATRALLPPSSPWLWLGFAALLLTPWFLAKLVFFGVSRRRADASVAALAVAWIGLGLLPVLNLVPLSAPSPVAERFWYLPLGGATLLAGVALDMFARVRRYAYWGAMPLLLACTFVTGLRVPDWASDHALWTAEVRRHGIRHPLTARNIGQVYLGEGLVQEAEAVWRRALRVGLGGGSMPFYELGVDLCRLLVSQGRSGEAAAIARQLLSSSPPVSIEQSLELFVVKEKTLMPEREGP